MRTAHKRLGEHLEPHHVSGAKLMEAYDNLADQALIEAKTDRRQIKIGDMAAREIVLSVLKEDLRLAKLPYRRTGRGVSS